MNKWYMMGTRKTRTDLGCAGYMGKSFYHWLNLPYGESTGLCHFSGPFNSTNPFEHMI